MGAHRMVRVHDTDAGSHFRRFTDRRGHRLTSAATGTRSGNPQSGPLRSVPAVRLPPPCGHAQQNGASCLRNALAFVALRSIS
jgi:hypothetical protein